jgi:transcription elongation factor Elf1
VTEARTFTCSICGDPSTDICVYCTKDACANHLCAKCGRCSDCCECEVPLDAADAHAGAEPSSVAPEREG